MNAEDRSAFVVLGQTGHGKTVFLVHLIQAWLEGVKGGGRVELLPDAEEKARRGLQAIEAFPAPGRRTTSQAVATITRAFEEGRGVEGTQEPEDFFLQWYAGAEAPGEARAICLRDVPGYVFEEGDRWEKRGERWGEFLQGALGLLLVLDLGAALVASESSFAALIHRYIHAVSAAEAAARRAGASALPVALVFTRADLETRDITTESLRALPALRPLFAALEDRSRRIDASIHVVSCLRLSRAEGATDRKELDALIADLGRGLGRGLLERKQARRRRTIWAVGLTALLLYGAYAALAAWKLSPKRQLHEISDLETALNELSASEGAVQRYGVFPWWPGKSTTALRAHIQELEQRAMELLREHPALREADAVHERTRAEYSTALHGLQRLRMSFAHDVDLLFSSPAEHEALLRAKRRLARLESPSVRNLHEWEVHWRRLESPALKAAVARELDPVLAQELDQLEFSSRKQSLNEELQDLSVLEEFAQTHAGLGEALITLRREREWEHVRFLLERERELGERSTNDLLASLLTWFGQAQRDAWIADQAAYEMGRCLVQGVAAGERALLQRTLAEKSFGAALARRLWVVMPRVYAAELLAWNGVEGRPYLTRRLLGFADYAAILRATNLSSGAKERLAAFEAHIERLEKGRIGPYRVWLRSLISDAGDELFWMRLPATNDEGAVTRWREFGGIAQPVFRLLRLGEDLIPFATGGLVVGEAGWAPFTPRWEGRIAIGSEFEHEAGRGLRLEISDKGTAEHARPDWLAWVVSDVHGCFAPERLDGRILEVVIDRPAGGEVDARDPERKFQPAARQVLRVELEVQCNGQALRDGSAVFDFADWGHRVAAEH